MARQACYRIGPWTVDQELNRLTNGPRSVPLEPRAMNTLLYLLEHRGRTVSRDELLEHVWGKKALTDHAISVVIASLRAALEDDARDPRYLKTIRKKGYCLIEGSLSATASVERSASFASVPRWWTLRSFGWAAAGLGVLLLGVLAVVPAGPEAVPDEQLEILFKPLDLAQGAETNPANIDVVNDLLLMELSRYGQIEMADMNIGQTDQLLVSGQVAGTEEDIYVSLMVRPGGEASAHYGEKSSRAITDLATVVRQLVSTAFAGHRRAVHEGVSQEGEAQLLDRARYFWGFHQDDRNKLAYRMVKHLIRNNPWNADAHALLAEMYAALPGSVWGLKGINTFNLAVQHIQRAEELGAAPKYIWRTRARISHERDQDIVTATTLYRKALVADPLDQWNWRSMAVALAMNGQFGEALEAHDRAIALSLEPVGALSEKMVTLYFAGRFEEAAALQQRLEGLDGRANVRAALIPYMAGHHEQAFDRWWAYFEARDKQSLAAIFRDRQADEVPVRTYLRVLEHDDSKQLPSLLLAYLNLAAGRVGEGVALLSEELDLHQQRKLDPGYDRRFGRQFLTIRIDPFLTRFERDQLVRDLIGRMKA